MLEGTVGYFVEYMGAGEAELVGARLYPEPLGLTGVGDFKFQGFLVYFFIHTIKRGLEQMNRVQMLPR